jgi:hypothetical protein
MKKSIHLVLQEEDFEKIKLYSEKNTVNRVYAIIALSQSGELKLEDYSNSEKDGVRNSKVDDQEFTRIVANSFSAREAIRAQGLVDYGASYKVFRRRVKRLGLDTSHFDRNPKENQQCVSGFQRPIEDYLSGKFPISSFSLKKKLFKAGMKDNKCENCGNTHHNGEPIPTHLDHIDGNSLNNSLDNLRILCPNCHARTDTYCGKNKKKAV